MARQTPALGEGRRPARAGARGGRATEKSGPGLPSVVSPARAIALGILERVEKTQAFANLLLDARLREARLSAADRALATTLSYGVLRWRGKLDWILGRVADRPLAELDPVVLQLLRLGAYQLCCLDRIPAFAAVDETVRLARRRAGRSAGYVNAVLRAVAANPRPPAADPAADALAYWTTAGSHPAWLVRRWIERLGADEAGRLMAANNEVPPLTVVANPLRASPAEATCLLAEAGIAAESGRLAPGVFRLAGEGGPADLPGFAAGVWIPMDEAGVLPVLALDLAPGQQVLDACAGGGGKTALIAAAVGERGAVQGLDSSPRALQRLAAALARLGPSNVQAMAGDARTAGVRWPAAFARILVDAPCTGLGTIRRRPEIKWRRQPEDLAAAAAVQQTILAGVAPALVPDGVLVYSTCSLEPEETVQVIETFLAAHPSFSLDDLAAQFSPDDGLLAGGMVQAWPHRQGTDGFFVARLRRRG